MQDKWMDRFVGVLLGMVIMLGLIILLDPPAPQQPNIEVLYHLPSGILYVDNVTSFNRTVIDPAVQVHEDRCVLYFDRIVFERGDPTIAVYRDCNALNYSSVTFYDDTTLERVDM